MLKELLTDAVVALIEPEWLIVRSLYRNREYAGQPQLSVARKYALSRSGTNLDIREVRLKSGGEAMVKPFSHPRVVVTDTEVAALLLKQFLYQLYGRSYLLPSVSMYLYPPTARRADLTFLEAEALREAAHKAGARDAYVVTVEKVLTADDVKELKAIKLEKYLDGEA